jgi:tyrosyl-tRNA synthetase
MFGKIMSISDEMMLKYYTLLSDENLEEVRRMHPKEAKVNLAKIIITQYHSKKEAEEAHLEFTRVFSQKETPQDIPEFKTDGKKTVLIIMTESGLVKSGNEARRLLKQGGVFFNDEKIDKESFLPASGILKVGSRRFLKIILK